jgi:hypothetical protein
MVASAAVITANAQWVSDPTMTTIVESQSSGHNQWDQLFELAATKPEVLQILNSAVVSANQIVAMDPSCYRRALRFEDIPSNAVDTLALSAGTNKEARALSISDCTQANFLRSHGVTLALAVRHAGRAEHVARMNEILVSTLQWVPFQRPGWSLGSASSSLSSGGDGVNMATSWSIIGLVDILEILGDRIPGDLRTDLKNSLRRELASIVDTWACARAWYVPSGAVVSNQWIDPNTAAIQACLYLRDDRLRPVYEFAVQNLSRSLNALQPDGAFLEGWSYAQMSLPMLFRAVNETAKVGDTRLQSAPFVRNSWRWMLCAQMPGGNLVSSGDSRMAVLPNWAAKAPLDAIAMAALSSGTPDAIPSVRALFPECGVWSSASTYASRVASAAPLSSPAISPWGYFPSQQLVTWREEWSTPLARGKDIGLWIKGGSLLESSHGQRDQGQVSIYCGETPILMERGTPDYGDADYVAEFASARGHGIMQVDPVVPSNRAVDAPAQVEHLDHTGGKVRVNLSAVYRTTRLCDREVQWSRGGPILITDSVEFSALQPAGTEIYRFHLGTSDLPQVVGSANEWTVSWNSASIRLTSLTPIQVEAVQMRNLVRQPGVHYALIIRVADSSSGLVLATEVTVHR